MHLVYGPNKAGLQHGGNNLLVVGHAGHSAALGIFHISGNPSLGAMVSWQHTDAQHQYELNIAGNLARNLEPLEVKLKIAQKNIKDINKRTAFGIGITGLDTPVLLETPNIPDLDVMKDVMKDVYQDISGLHPYLNRYYYYFIKNEINEIISTYRLFKYGIVRILSGTLFSRNIFPNYSKIKFDNHCLKFSLQSSFSINKF